MSSVVLVTGGAGFIGSHTVDLLLAEGYQVRVLDSLQPRVHPHGVPSWMPADVEFVRGDVSNRSDLAQALEGVRDVFHLAAYQDYLSDFSSFIHTNTESAALLFELVVGDPRRYPVEKIVFASSQSVCGEGRYLCAVCAGRPAPSLDEQLVRPVLAYGMPPEAVYVPDSRALAQLEQGTWELGCPRCAGPMQPLLIDESTVSPGTAYGISKYAIELLADRLGARYGIATACMRYTYVQGPRNSFYNAYSGIARRFALRLMHGLPPVVYEDGGQLRDFVNVRDVARANVTVLRDPRAARGVFNVGGGRAVSVLEFTRLMIEAFGSPLEPEVAGDFRVGDTRHTVSDISRMRGLGWTPAVPVETNVKEYVEWMREQRGTRAYLDEAERVMTEQGVVRRAGVRA